MNPTPTPDSPEPIKTHASSAKSRLLGFSHTEIPYPFLLAIARIIKEGETVYGRLNWLRGHSDPIYRRERRNHLINHLLLWNHLETFGPIGIPEDLRQAALSEDHLAKAAWGIMCEVFFRQMETSSMPPEDIQLIVQEALENA